jgi:hypothetical protein
LLQHCLGSDLVGLYLHGSAAMRAWTPTRSDVDLLAVVARSLTPSERRDIGEALLAMPSPGVGLEVSMVTVAAAREATSAPPFELHVAGAEDRMVDGSGHGDDDLLAHFAMTRAPGVPILGRPPSDVIGEPPTSALLRSLAADLEWAMDNRNYGYVVLNACRGLMYAREGTLGSKG